MPVLSKTRKIARQQRRVSRPGRGNSADRTKQRVVILFAARPSADQALSGFPSLLGGANAGVGSGTWIRTTVD